MYDGQPKTEKDITTEEIWYYYNRVIIGLSSLVLKQYQNAEGSCGASEPSDNLTVDDTNNIHMAVAKVEELSKLYVDLCLKTVRKDNASIKEQIDLVIPRFNHCLKT